MLYNRYSFLQHTKPSDNSLYIRTVQREPPRFGFSGLVYINIFSFFTRLKTMQLRLDWLSDWKKIWKSVISKLYWLLLQAEWILILRNNCIFPYHGGKSIDSGKIHSILNTGNPYSMQAISVLSIFHIFSSVYMNLPCDLLELLPFFSFNVFRSSHFDIEHCIVWFQSFICYSYCSVSMEITRVK